MPAAADKVPARPVYLAELQSGLLAARKAEASASDDGACRKLVIEEPPGLRSTSGRSTRMGTNDKAEIQQRRQTLRKTQSWHPHDPQVIEVPIIRRHLGRES